MSGQISVDREDIETLKQHLDKALTLWDMCIRGEVPCEVAMEAIMYRLMMARSIVYQLLNI